MGTLIGFLIGFIIGGVGGVVCTAILVADKDGAE